MWFHQECLFALKKILKRVWVGHLSRDHTLLELNQNDQVGDGGGYHTGQCGPKKIILNG